MKSKSKIYIDGIVNSYKSKDESKSVEVFKKMDAQIRYHYGCRYYDNGVFQFDEFYPNKSLHYAESAASNWCQGVKTK